MQLKPLAMIFFIGMFHIWPLRRRMREFPRTSDKMYWERHLRHRWKVKYSEQISSGKAASRVYMQALIEVVDETPLLSVHTDTLHEKYVSFRPEHCPPG